MFFWVDGADHEPCGSAHGHAAVAAVIGQGIDDIILPAFLPEQLFVEQFGDGVGELLGVESGKRDGEGMRCQRGLGNGPPDN